MRHRKRGAGAIFIAPAAAFFGVFLLFPIVAVILLAFTSWNGFYLDQIGWNGVGNVRQLGSDTVVRTALAHTVLFVAVSTVALNVFGLLFAMLIHTRVRAHDFLRVAMFLPLGLAPVVTAILWQQILGPYGMVNTLLINDLHVRKTPIGFLGDPKIALWTVITAAVWQYSGYNMLLYYAGLQNLPTERLEAASIDGAGPWAQFRYVVLPYLRPVVAVVVVLNLIGGWKVFELVYVMTSGGPDRATEVLSTYLYQQAFSFNAVGYASSIALLIIALATISALLRSRLAGETA